MRTAILSAILLSIALADITCTSSQVYLKVSKQSGASWACEESYEIYGNGALLYTSPTFADGELRVTEYCLTATTNSQYSLKIKDSYGDSWASGSWVMLEGLYGNRVYKGFLTASLEETVPFSLYYGVSKQDQ